MSGALADLTVAGKLLGRAVARRLGGGLDPAPDLDAFEAAMLTALESAPEGTIRGHAWLDMPATSPPWLESGLSVQPGDELSWFIAGRVYANKLLDVYFNPSLQVWCRVGQAGEVFRGTRGSHSFTVSQPGDVAFGNYFPNTWASRTGELAQGDEAYRSNSGDFRILLIHWNDTALSGLEALRTAGGGNPWLDAELDRLQQGNTTPEGWQYLWHVGPAEIFRQGNAPDGAPCVHCQTHEDVGILQKAVDLPLTPDTEISWRWCVQELPSTLREDTVPSHDYLSIAVEFDNGRDITYYWSSALAEGTGYDCPLPNWSGIEYHVVVRSGPQGLGEWLAERRNLYRDYAHYMGEPPARITRVWFIAVSIFQRGNGQCDYADIEIHGPHGTVGLL